VDLVKQFEKAFYINGVGNVVTFNRERGLLAAIGKTIPDVTQAYCC
jgi:hypothetical protein